MRRWLALLVAATTSLVLIALLVPLALLVRALAESGAVTQATAEAQSVAAVVGTADAAGLTLTAERTSAAGGHAITVFLPDGQVVGARAARSPAVELAARGQSLTAETPSGLEVLVAVQGLPAGTAVVRAFLGEDDLRRGVREVWLGMLVLGLTLIGVGIGVADRLALALTRPMSEMARVSHRLAAGDLTARTTPGGPPEVRDVGLALDHLAGRISDLLAEERESAADLSHRLRTPLTGLRLEAESLSDPEEAARLGTRVDALERAVTSVIQDVRRRSREQASCDAARVVAERVAFWSVLAEDQGRAAEVAVPPGPLEVAVSAAELSACVDALLGNVFAHTPEGAAFSVRLAPEPGGALLVVADHGPGFRPLGGSGHPLERGRSGAGSTGLGLDIARRTAEASGGSLTLDAAPGGGARVVLRLGAPADSGALR
ncbi:two-component sensor histidine kinase [Sphaerisporangium melleum]|uniref:Signal transduction histidine-protein kinase/phosphatase MprB n=1 Tax=Sphaerisporangium melleum TaxID=321316 RepID=A0A917R281_9ACTN|nr:HAMP domain-containing sensor histidine kinase [Sphaerisporangium melleum]GGK82725.1 two-component sensor histidine kinase [Sphaerisporangium melleum]GII69199.1 two-component sensor histidine kinase [Sphaerisporangium melleum]